MEATAPAAAASSAPASGQGFAARAAAAMETYGPLVFGLDPSRRVLVEWGMGDDADGLDAFVDIAVEAVTGSVGVVKPQSAFYERWGWRGIRSLARLVEGCRAAGVLVILDAKRGDVGSTNQAYADAYLGPSAGIPVDALTVTPYLGLAAMGPILEGAAGHGAGVFVVTRSSNPEGRALQRARHDDGTTVEAELVLAIGAENLRVAPCAAVGPYGAVWGPTHGGTAGRAVPGGSGDVDLRLMRGLFLAPGVGAQRATPAAVAASFPDCPERVLPSASRSLLDAGPEPAALREAAGALAAELRTALFG